MTFETIEHTADIGLRIRASNRSELFSEAAKGFFSLLLAHPERIEEKESHPIEISGEDSEDLLHDWLGELLFLFDTQQLVFCRFDVECSDSSIQGICFGEPLESERHQPEMEIKAVTYHGLKMRRIERQWQAEVIFDI
jgi:SHS2 domain-containing protein